MAELATTFSCTRIAPHLTSTVAVYATYTVIFYHKIAVFAILPIAHKVVKGAGETFPHALDVKYIHISTEQIIRLEASPRRINPRQIQ